MSTQTATFTVTNVWDLETYEGFLASGKMQGNIRQGMTLQNELQQSTRVLSLEFLSPRDIATQESTIVLERADPNPVTVGAVLASVSQRD